MGIKYDEQKLEENDQDGQNPDSTSMARLGSIAARNLRLDCFEEDYAARY